MDPRLPYHQRPKPALVDEVNIDESVRKDMKGIDPAITSHELNVDSTYKPMRQKRRKLGADKAQAVNEEVEKLLRAGSITEVKYPEWLANPVVVKKKNGKWRVCVDFTDLNKACPKDSFPLPHIDRLVEATAGNELLSFMDAFSGYNQIFMHPDDREKTAFITDCYKVMPWPEERRRHLSTISEQNVRGPARRIPRICCDPTRDRGKPEADLGDPRPPIADILQRNPKTHRTYRRIEQIHLALNRQMSPLLPIASIKQEVRVGQKCEDAFKQLKEYLTTPPILAKPEEGETLLLYIAISSTAVSGVLVREDRGEQQPVFYVSKTLNDAETRYPTLEKLALAVVISARKLRPYFQSHSIVVFTSQPLRQILHGPNQSGRMARWAIELSEYDIEFKSRTSAKSQVLADFIVEIPPELATQEDEQILKWTLHVDGSSSRQGAGVGIRLVSPTGEILEQSIKLGFPASNNEAEYEAIIAGLRLAEAVGAEHVRAFCDSQLVAKQFSDPRSENSEADALAALASKTESALRRVIPVETIDEPSIKLPKGTVVMAISQEEEEDENLTDDESAEHKSWQDEIRNYLINDAVPEERWAARRLRRKAAYYFLRNNELFRWSANKVILRCCDEAQAKSIMVETHEGASGNHAGGRSLALKIKKIGYFWPTMIGDCINVAAKCVPCQRYAPAINAPTQALQAAIPAYPFMRWGMDIVGPMPRSRQCAYLLVVTDYFTKWVEAKAYKNPTAHDVRNFVWQYIICRHGLPYEIVTDNGGQFVAALSENFARHGTSRSLTPRQDILKLMDKPSPQTKLLLMD
ncbi:unnamed protein product [Microthlaspi erraticum]|uniref:Integrase catalytic domain-containing protein n=1 Tax=Microthlaspi erraticum TaxID=1685480 RepID=A0A6D2IMR3_9BRAS|nr:unnamed protein product [Microthlaspi erraticum]